MKCMYGWYTWRWLLQRNRKEIICLCMRIYVYAWVFITLMYVSFSLSLSMACNKYDKIKTYKKVRKMNTLICLFCCFTFWDALLQSSATVLKTRWHVLIEKKRVLKMHKKHPWIHNREIGVQFDYKLVYGRLKCTYSRRTLKDSLVFSLCILLLLLLQPK